MRPIDLALPPGSRADEGWYRVGVVAAVLLLVGSGWYQLLTVPPYYAADEQAHAGYVLALEDGHLPTIDTPIDAGEGGEDLQQQIARSRERQRGVWVANNPPLAYLVAVPAAVVAQVLGLPGGPLLGLRVANLAAFAAAVVLVARLARRLSGGNPVIGLTAAAAFASVPHVGAIAGAGFVDGLALLCTVALADALVELTRSGPTRRQIATVAAWCAAGAAVRPMTAVVAAVAAAIAWAVVLVHHRRRPTAPADPGPGIVWSAAVLALPTVLTSGWFYLRNVRLYGDATASRALFDRFERVERPGGLPDVLRTEVWADPVRTLLNRRLPQDAPSSPLWLWHVTRWLVAVLVAVAVVLVVADVVRARRAGRPPATPVAGATAVGALGVLAAALGAQHWLGGGNIHPRYLLFPLVAVVALAAAAVVALGRRVAAVAVVAALLAVQVVQIPRQNRSLPRPGWALLPPSSSLTEPTGPTALRWAGLALVVVAFAGFAVALWRVQVVDPEPARPGPVGTSGH